MNVRNDGAVNSRENTASSVISDAGTGNAACGSISGNSFHARQRTPAGASRAGHHGQRAANARSADPQRRHPADHRPRHGWPRLGEPLARYRGQYCYIDALLPGHREPTPILRLPYQGSAGDWAIGIYKASTGQYSENELPGAFAGATGTPEQRIEETFILYAGPRTAN